MRHPPVGLIRTAVRGGRLLYDLAEAVRKWAEWATGVETWPDDPRAAEPERATFEEIARLYRDRSRAGTADPRERRPDRT